MTRPSNYPKELWPGINKKIADKLVQLAQDGTTRLESYNIKTEKWEKVYGAAK